MINENISMPTGNPYAGFWRRTGAWIIDACIIYAAYLLIAFFIWDDLLIREVVENGTEEGTFFYTPSLLGLLLVGISVWLYIALQECSHAQASIGKRILSIRVCDYNGDRITFLSASYRAWPLWLPGLINSVAILDGIVSLLSIGACLAVLFTKRKQGLHDIMAGCLVVKRRAVFTDTGGQT